MKNDERMAIILSVEWTVSKLVPNEKELKKIFTNNVSAGCSSVSVFKDKKYTAVLNLYSFHKYFIFNALCLFFGTS